MSPVLCILQCTSKGVNLDCTLYDALLCIRIPYSNCTCFTAPWKFTSLVSSFVSLRGLIQVGDRSWTHLVSIIHASGIYQASCSFSLVNGRGSCHPCLATPEAPSHWPDWLTKASTLLYHVRVPGLTIVLYSHSTMVKRRTEHASSQPQRDLCALLGRYVVNSQCAFPCQ